MIKSEKTRSVNNHAEVHGHGAKEVQTVKAVGWIALAHRVLNDGITMDGKKSSETFLELQRAFAPQFEMAASLDFRVGVLNGACRV